MDTRERKLLMRIFRGNIPAPFSKNRSPRRFDERSPSARACGGGKQKSAREASAGGRRASRKTHRRNSTLVKGVVIQRIAPTRRLLRTAHKLRPFNFALLTETPARRADLPPTGQFRAPSPLPAALVGDRNAGTTRHSFCRCTLNPKVEN